MIRDEDPLGILHREITGKPLRQWKPWDVFHAYKGKNLYGDAISHLQRGSGFHSPGVAKDRQ